MNVLVNRVQTHYDPVSKNKRYEIELGVDDFQDPLHPQFNFLEFLINKSTQNSGIITNKDIITAAMMLRIKEVKKE